MRYVKRACTTNLHFICRSASSLKVACLFQVMLNLHVTRMELIRNVHCIRHTPGTHRTYIKFFSMFDFFGGGGGGGGGGGANAPRARSDLQRRISTCNKRTPSLKNALLTRF